MNSMIESMVEHMHSKGKSIIEISRTIDMSPGKVKDILQRLAKPVSKPVMNKVTGFPRSQYRGDVTSFVDRDPCVCCGVRKDKHDEMGCKRWRGE